MNKDRKDVLNKPSNCKYCGISLSEMRITDAGNHVKNCRLKHDPEYKKLYTQKVSKNSKQVSDKRFGLFIQHTVICDKCKKQFIVVQRQKLFPKKSKYYCSLSCSKSRVIVKVEWTDQMKQLASQRSKKLWQNQQYVKKVLANNSKFYTSKGQRKIRDFIVQKYRNDQWTWGSLKSYNGVTMCPDLFSHKLKFIFQYDGCWHFKDIFKDDTLSKKQDKDKLLQQWCIVHDYKLLRISQSWFIQNNEDQTIVQKLILDMVNSKQVQIIKLGNQYNM